MLLPALDGWRRSVGPASLLRRGATGPARAAVEREEEAELARCNCARRVDAVVGLAWLLGPLDGVGPLQVLVVVLVVVLLALLRRRRRVVRAMKAVAGGWRAGWDGGGRRALAPLARGNWGGALGDHGLARAAASFAALNRASSAFHPTWGIA